MRNCSPHTILSYRTSLDQLLYFAKTSKNTKLGLITFDDLNDGMVTAYLDDLEVTKKYSVSSRNLRLACLKAFYRYASMRDTALTVYKQAIDRVPKKKDNNTEPIKYLSEAAVKVLLNQPDITTSKGIRDQFIMVLMYDTAARIQEIINLKICDFRADSLPQIQLYGKGRKTRMVPLMKETMDHYNRYMSLFHPGESSRSEKPLFYSHRNGKCSPISDDLIRTFMNQYAKKAHEICNEVPESIHPHMWRHTRAMHLYQHGMDLTLVSQWLGHASLSATMIYAYADTEMKRKAIEKATIDIPLNSTKNELVDEDEMIRRLYGLK